MTATPREVRRPLLSLVIPVYFNEENLPVTWEAILPVLSALEESADWEVVFVDDGSGDGSYDQISALHERYPSRVRAVRFTRNFGQVAAMLAGLEHARGDCAVLMSADLQDPPELIERMHREWASGARIVLAVRTGRGDGPIARVGSRIFYSLMRRYAIPNMPRGGFDFFLVDRRVIDLMNSIQEKNTFIQGHVLWTGFNPTIIEYTRRKREIGRSRWTLGRKLKYFADGFVTYTLAPIRLMTLTGLLVSAVAFGWAGVVLFRYVIHSHPVEGWTPLMLAVLFLGGIQLVMLGVVGEYLWRSYYEARKLPNFVVDTVLDTEETA